MGPDDIAIQIVLAVERPLKIPRAFAWPPTIRPGKVIAGFEGLPRRIGVYQASTRIGRREVSLFVLFGRGKPTTGQLNRANTELRRARLG